MIAPTAAPPDVREAVEHGVINGLCEWHDKTPGVRGQSVYDPPAALVTTLTNAVLAALPSAPVLPTRSEVYIYAMCKHLEGWDADVANRAVNALIAGGFAREDDAVLAGDQGEPND